MDGANGVRADRMLHTPDVGVYLSRLEAAWASECSLLGQDASDGPMFAETDGRNGLAMVVTSCGIGEINRRNIRYDSLSNLRTVLSGRSSILAISGVEYPAA